MTDRRTITSRVETDPFKLSPDQTAVLNIGRPIEGVLLDVVRGCTRECTLGAGACNLALTVEPELRASCNDCPNPQIANLAVSEVVRVGDERLEKISQVPLFKNETPPDNGLRFRELDVEGIDGPVIALLFEDIESYFDKDDFIQLDTALRNVFHSRREWASKLWIFTSDIIDLETKHLHILCAMEFVKAAESNSSEMRSIDLIGNRRHKLLMRLSKLIKDSPDYDRYQRTETQ